MKDAGRDKVPINPRASGTHCRWRPSLFGMPIDHPRRRPASGPVIACSRSTDARSNRSASRTPGRDSAPAVALRRQSIGERGGRDAAFVARGLGTIPGGASRETPGSRSAREARGAPRRWRRGELRIGMGGRGSEVGGRPGTHPHRLERTVVRDRLVGTRSGLGVLRGDQFSFARGGGSMRPGDRGDDPVVRVLRGRESRR